MTEESECCLEMHSSQKAVAMARHDSEKMGGK